MWIQRLICLLRGHRLLRTALAYAQQHAETRGQELHYCVRCGCAVWTSLAPRAVLPPKWVGAGEV